MVVLLRARRVLLEEVELERGRGGDPVGQLGVATAGGMDGYLQESAGEEADDVEFAGSGYV